MLIKTNSNPRGAEFVVEPFISDAALSNELFVFFDDSSIEEVLNVEEPVIGKLTGVSLAILFFP